MRRSVYCLTLLLLCGIAFSKTIHVPEDKATIQAGIDSAAIGDSVLVQPGTYLENLNFNAKNIVVGSLFLTTGDTSYISQTVIDGNGSTVVRFENGEDSTAVLGGFTLINSLEWIGSGIICNGAGPRLIHLLIQGIGSGLGGGLYCDNSANPQLMNTTIIDNYAENGGGIYCDNNSNPKLVNVTIADNVAMCAGGIYCVNSGLTLEDVIVANNTAYYFDDVGGGDGGGIHCQSSNVIMKNVVITGNHALSYDYPYRGIGGGIWCYESSLNLANVTISHNSADTGGGIFCSDSDLNFSFENRCNIYWNYAISGNEVVIAGENIISVVVDTFTVFNPSDRHIYPVNQCTYNILHAQAIPAEADLYVSPSGDDSNSGLIPSEPLQSIRMAVEKMIADSLNSRTIFLDDGNYSSTTTNEVFPIKMKSYITLQGDSEGIVTIDAEGGGSVFYLSTVNEVNIKNVTMTGGYENRGGGIYCKGSSLNLENVQIQGNWAHSVYTEGPPGVIEGQGGGIYFEESRINIENSAIQENQTGNSGGGIYNSGSAIQLKNVSICRNEGHDFYHGPTNGGGIYQNGGQLFLLNTIVWDNAEEEIYLSGNNNISEIAYSDIEGGLDSMIVGKQDTVYWLGGNIDVDPLFVNPDSGDFNLQEGSPCIDAGTPFFIWQGDTILNLSGADYNGDAPDMGAYESDFTSVSQFRKRLPDRYSLSQNYPNPFNPETLIQYDLPKQGHVKIDIYNLLGQNVITLTDENKAAGSYSVRWKGLDRFGNRLPSGTYLLRMDCGEFFQVHKIVLMK